MLCSEGSSTRMRWGRSGLAAMLIVAAWVVLALAACGGSGEAATSSGSEGDGSGGDSAAAAASPAAAVDYAALLTLEDVRAITGHKDATPMPESEWGMRAGSSKYFALYQAEDWPEAVWFRVNHKGTFEEARKASDTPAVTIPGLGDDAFWWDYTDVQRGLAVLVGDDTYEIMTTLAWDKPQMTDDQMLEIAKTVVGRLQQ
jgi:hypothetical protein